ncbi:transposase family [Shigella flexneri]|uniref:transposase n=1 Tax=Shigella flexneri TaxID=623 RepID=UPI000DA51F7E|nr:transposase family [Shigella flexneri]
MSRKTQRYSKEFKAEAVRTVLENQLSISLRKALNEARLERDILKKATAYFAQESFFFW